MLVDPKTRAPLGNKTTNAKALKTPLLGVPVAQKDGSEEGEAGNKPTSPRLRRSKIKVHETIESAEDVLAKDPEEREMEYMAPRGVPLNDDPDDFWPNELNLDVLKGTNRTRGWWSEFNPGKEPNDDDSELSDLEEKCKKLDAEQAKEKKAKSIVKPAPSSAVNRPRPVVKAAPTTLRAQNAASALGSKTTSASSAPRFAAPTTAAKARQPTASSSTATKPKPGLTNPRFTAAKAASNTTLGYSKGRAVSASARRPLSDLHAKPQQGEKEAAAPEKTITYLDELLGLNNLDVGDELFSATMPVLSLPAEEEDEVFQLDPVEDL